MLFNSFRFAVFFPIVTLLYFLLPLRVRWAWLLLASCYFYMCFIPVYILILFVTISVDYAAGILIEGSAGSRRKVFLVGSIFANVGMLAFFKYANFFAANATAAAGLLGISYAAPLLRIVLPIGLSFHTFQSLSYTIEVYRGKQAAERHLGIFALYVMFYPQLVAGPIERPQNLLHQFREEHRFDYTRVTSGLKLIAWGLFKKVVVADRLALIVDRVYDKPHGFTGLPLILATVAFAWQIYCDFSGYSDIARGCARVTGFRLMENFKLPYFSRSISEFWTRWHVSLSTWFKDYMYIPLGGNRVSRPLWIRNLFLTFLISGLWHGANWTFVVWGALHGAFLTVALLTGSARKELSAGVLADRLVVFVAVTFAWIFFRANSMADASYVISHLFNGLAQGLSGVSKMAIPRQDWIIAGFFLTLLIGIEASHNRRSVAVWLSARGAAVRWSAYAALIFAITAFGHFGEAQFIYFQF